MSLSLSNVWLIAKNTTYFKMFCAKIFTQHLFNPYPAVHDNPYICKQCRPRSDGFWRSHLIRIYTVCHSVWNWTKTLYDVIWLADSQKWVWLIWYFSRIRVKFFTWFFFQIIMNKSSLWYKICFWDEKTMLSNLKCTQKCLRLTGQKFQRG